MFFWNSLAFSMIQRMQRSNDNLISGSSAFSKSNLNIWEFSVHILLNPDLENFEDYFTSVWDCECNCAVVWAFFCIAHLWDWNENWPQPFNDNHSGLCDVILHYVFDLHFYNNQPGWYDFLMSIGYLEVSLENCTFNLLCIFLFHFLLVFELFFFFFLKK